jgi:hypothetical protein
MREYAGVIYKDWFRYQSSLNHRDKNYLRLTNRLERISSGPEDVGYVCLWPHTSKLHAPLIVPSLGKSLLERCLQESLFEMKEQRQLEMNIELSVLIGHRGLSRLPLLLTTIRSIASQIDVGLECIVIEQDKEPKIKDYLPTWVRYLFIETGNDSTVYNRSASFNLGAKNAKGKILILHDNDMLIPKKYCKNIVGIVNHGYEVVNLKRFVFYMSRTHTNDIITSTKYITAQAPEYIIQNLEAGGSMAITKEAYSYIGGMDEAFVGWGGEDVEFWKRCSVLKRWIWAYEPIVHLWHPSQPLKEKADNPNIERLRILNELDLNDRIAVLRSRFEAQY